MLPKTAEYALRAVVSLGRVPDSLQSADRLAKATRVPRRYLHKVLQDLIKAGLVRSSSGPGGGYALARPSDEITILDAVNAAGGIERIRTCPLGLDSHTSLCPLHQELDKAYSTMEDAFSRVSVAEVLNRQAASSPLCATQPRTFLTVPQQIEAFLEGSPHAVAGASRDRRKYGNKVLRAYIQQGRAVHPVNPHAAAVEGLVAFSDLAALPTLVHGVSIVTPPRVTEQIVAQAAELGIRHLWMQPGSESDRAIELARQAGMNVIGRGPCILVALRFQEDLAATGANENTASGSAHGAASLPADARQNALPPATLQ